MTLSKDNLPLLLSQLDQFWDPAPEATVKQIREVLAESDQPLAREAAARALGHMADGQSIKPLIAALGDPDKMVQRTAAWALRIILERRPEVAAEGRDQLAGALNPRMRACAGAQQSFSISTSNT